MAELRAIQATRKEELKQMLLRKKQRDEELRLEKERAEQAMQEQDMQEESFSEEEPIPTRKRKREREVSVQPYSDPTPTPPPVRQKKPRRADPTPLPYELTWKEHAINAVYGAAPIMASGTLLLLGLVFSIANNTPVQIHTPSHSIPSIHPILPPSSGHSGMFDPSPPPSRSVHHLSLLD